MSVEIEFKNEKLDQAMGTIGGALLGLVIGGPLGAAIGAFMGAWLTEPKSREQKREVFAE